MRRIKDFVPFPAFIAIIGLLFILISYIETISHQTEVTLFLIGWALLIISGFKYFQYTHKG